MHLLHNLVAAPSCVFLNRAGQTQQSSGGLCNQLGSLLFVCQLRAELRHRAPSQLRITPSTLPPPRECNPCAPFQPSCPSTFLILCFTDPFSLPTLPSDLKPVRKEGRLGDTPPRCTGLLLLVCLGRSHSSTAPLLLKALLMSK